ncbi:hypothetical protein ABW21_db0206454 [Orbilia brochopaga]|nr:hypothetical protein ABW21_db0206454 [Drechslerella brochopaga]
MSDVNLLFLEIIPGVEKLRTEVTRAMGFSRTLQPELVSGDVFHRANFPYIAFEGLLAALDRIRLRTITTPGLSEAIDATEYGKLLTAIKFDNKLRPELHNGIETGTIEFARLGPATTPHLHWSLPQPPYCLRVGMHHERNTTTIVDFILSCDRKLFQ